MPKMIYEQRCNIDDVTYLYGSLAFAKNQAEQIAEIGITWVESTNNSGQRVWTDITSDCEFTITEVTKCS